MIILYELGENNRYQEQARWARGTDVPSEFEAIMPAGDWEDMSDDRDPEKNVVGAVARALDAPVSAIGVPSKAITCLMLMRRTRRPASSTRSRNRGGMRVGEFDHVIARRTDVTDEPADMRPAAL